MKKNAPSGLTPAQFLAIALSFPGALEKLHYNQPSVMIAKKFFTRLRCEDNSAVLTVGSIDERDILLEAEPALFHITEHYRNYPTVLARLDALDEARLRAMLQRRWDDIAPKALRG
jgi:hypothetical protein